MRNQLPPPVSFVEPVWRSGRVGTIAGQRVTMLPNRISGLYENNVI